VWIALGARKVDSADRQTQKNPQYCPDSQLIRGEEIR
jgi:hypothetical protein